VNRFFAKALIASIFVTLTTGTVAFAQLTDQIDVTVPFRFYAGDTWLPAGKYRITVPDSSDPSVLLIQNHKDTVETFLATHPTSIADYPADAQVDFDRLGKKDFLSTIWVGGEATGYQLEEPRYEKKLEKAALRKEKHSLKAHHTKS
jgi:hypothetical protein